MLKNIEPESRVEYLLEKQKKSNIEKNSICNTTLYDPYIKPSTVAEPALATMVDNMYRQCEDQSLSTMDDNIFDGMNMFMQDSQFGDY
jgi:hypothetical protein